MPTAPDGTPLPYDKPDPLSDLRAAIEILQTVQQAEPDDQDSQKISKIVADLYAILAGRQKEMDDAMGGRMSPSFLRRG